MEAGHFLDAATDVGLAVQWYNMSLQPQQGSCAARRFCCFTSFLLWHEWC